MLLTFLNNIFIPLEIWNIILFSTLKDIKLYFDDSFIFNQFFSEVEERAPIVNEEYAKRLEGSSIYLALQLAGGKRKSVEHAG